MPFPEAHLYLSREQLYELVWAKPMQHLAKQYGVSDRALAKLCTRRQVPVPPRGYWAKKQSGGKVQQPKLLPFKEKEEKPKLIEEKMPRRRDPIVSGGWQDREKKIKQAVKEFRQNLRDGVNYAVRIDSWSCDFSFGLNGNYNPLKRDGIAAFMYREPYHETRWFLLRGEFVSPKELIGQKVRINLSQSNHLDEQERNKNLSHYEENPPTSVGSLYKEEADYWALLFIPTNAETLLLHTVSAGKANAVTIYGGKIRHRHADIFSFSVKDKIEPDTEDTINPD